MSFLILKKIVTKIKNAITTLGQNTLIGTKKVVEGPWKLHAIIDSFLTF